MFLVGRVPSLKEGNLKENIFCFPWVQDTSVQLGMILFYFMTYDLFTFNSPKLKMLNLTGCRFKDAFQDPGLYFALEPLFEVHIAHQLIYVEYCSVSWGMHLWTFFYC